METKDADPQPDPVEALRTMLADALPGSHEDNTIDACIGRIVTGLIELGHVVPGMPPAARIVEDTRMFAEKLILSNLALKIVRMKILSRVQTPETLATVAWLRDYFDGKNHGPAGGPMLWPTTLPALCVNLREWGFIPTPGTPAYVARAPLAAAGFTVQ